MQTSIHNHSKKRARSPSSETRRTKPRLSAEVTSFSQLFTQQDDVLPVSQQQQITTIQIKDVMEQQINADAGVIETVQLCNFMNHTNFCMKFHPCINVISGSNGSGKSAILTAIQVCFGAKAVATQRGKNLADLIRKSGTETIEYVLKKNVIVKF